MEATGNGSRLKPVIGPRSIPGIEPVEQVSFLPIVDAEFSTKKPKRRRRKK